LDKRLLDSNTIAQICFITDDLEGTAAWFADLTGMTPSAVGKSADYDEAKATYHGQPANVSCRQIIFKFDNIDVEFLQPGPEKSAWRDLLEAKGPGVHHIAFKTRNMSRRGAYLAGKGAPELQKALFDGAEGRYAYYDTTPQLGIQLELLEWNKDREPQA
jgi:methylmalonyl-CoA/ethylmalonyl-CoA epimerase